MSVQSVADAKKLIATETIESLVVEVNTDIIDDYCDIHQLHQMQSKMQIIAVVANYSDTLSKKLQEIGVSEILIKNETFYVAVPNIIKGNLARKVNKVETSKIDTQLKHSDYVQMTSRTFAHEINNPLMSILGLTELILDDKSRYDQELVKKIKVIQKSALRIQETTHRLTNISTPVYEKTAYGLIINPQKSKIRTKTLVKLDETE